MLIQRSDWEETRCNKPNDWIISFLKSFKTGTSRITEKQYNVLTRYANKERPNGYLYECKSDELGFTAYEHNGYGGTTYYITKAE